MIKDLILLIILVVTACMLGIEKVQADVDAENEFADQHFESIFGKVSSSQEFDFETVVKVKVIKTEFDETCVILYFDYEDVKIPTFNGENAVLFRCN